MKSYLLLRDNHQSGPYTFEDLIACKLRSKDLVWVEGYSAAWKYPDEIEELKVHVEQTQPAIEVTPPAVYVSLPSNYSRRQPAEHHAELYAVRHEEPVLETNYVKPYEELKENIAIPAEPKTLWSKKILGMRNTLNGAAVFIGLMLGAIFMKKMVDGLVDQTLGNETVASTASIIPQEKVADRQYQNALVTMVTPTVKEELKKPLPKPAKPKDIRKQVKVSGSNYKVGFFGGISGLELKVSNNSPHYVNQAEVEVTYLKPNGEAVASETIPVRALRPKSSQTITVPPSKRGVKVTYKVMNIYSRQYQSLLKDI
jgi:hypothetical protein